MSTDINWVTCPECSNRVLPRSDNRCPNCQAKFPASDQQGSGPASSAAGTAARAAGEPTPAVSSPGPKPPHSYGGLVMALLLFGGIFTYMAVTAANSPTSKANYAKIYPGMSLPEVERILEKRLPIPDEQRPHYTGTGHWAAVMINLLDKGADITVGFQDGVVVTKRRVPHQ